MSIKYKENLSKKTLSYHSKTNSKPNNNVVVNSQILVQKDTDIVNLTKKQTVYNSKVDNNQDEDDENFKNTIQSVNANDRKENFSLNFLDHQEGSGFFREGFLIDNIEKKLQNEVNLTLDNIDSLLSYFQKSPEIKINNGLKKIKEEIDIITLNLDHLQEEYSKISKKYKDLKNQIAHQTSDNNEIAKHNELIEQNKSLKRKVMTLEKKLKSLTIQYNSELEDKNKTRQFAVNPSKKNLVEEKISTKINRHSEIENIEKEILLNKLNYLKKEILLKDKEIKMLSSGFYQDQGDEYDDDDIRFEESFNVTNISDENNYNDGNYNIAEDQNISSDNDKSEFSTKNKAMYDIKKVEQNRKVKLLSDSHAEDDNKKNLKMSQQSQSKLGIKSNQISSESSRKK